MQRKRLIGLLVIALGITLSTSINHLQSLKAEETREIEINITRDKIINILKLRDEYIKEKEEQERLKAEEQKKQEEEIRASRGGDIDRVPMTFELSAYCSCSQCSDGWGTHTASGLPVQEGFCALPQDIPFGTKVVIPSLNLEYECQDRGGYIEYTDEGYMRVDVYMSSHQDCINFGRFEVEGYLEYK